ncbi:MAG TPA: alpha/beta fold hydrolase [Phnomibacter sp.]|nr:alpha/beta fold hydrolase [Phnomibacter sp.]
MWKIVRYTLLVYALLCGLYYAYQHLLYFQPKALTANHAFTFPVRVRFSSVKIPFDAHTVVDVVKFRSEQDSVKPKGVVLFFHGNRFNVEHYSTYAPYFTRHGYEVWMPDYPGFGRSTGAMEMDLLDDMAMQLYQMARAVYAPHQIVIYGKSLGTGVASFLAAQRDCRHLLLETPYYSLSSLTQAYAWFMPVPRLLRFNLRTGAFFREVTAPITVMAAGADEVIPIDNTLRLLPAMKATDALYIVKGAKHNALPLFDVYHQVMDSVMAR